MKSLLTPLCRPVLGAVAAVALAGAALPSVAGTLEGTVTYRDRHALSPDAVLEIALLDVSRADAPSVTLASLRMAMTGVPHRFVLGYDDALIDPRMRYTLRAAIFENGRRTYLNTTAYPVLTPDSPATPEVIVDRIATDAGASALVGATWHVTELNGAAPTTDAPAELTFPDNRSAAFHAGCNRFRGSVQIDGNALQFGIDWVGTRMACPPELDRLEREVMQTLARVEHVTSDGGGMALVDGAGGTLLRLRRAP